MNLHSIVGWTAANPWLAFGVVCWVVANVAPRPHPEQQERPSAKFFWMLIDRISVLTAETVPGKLKWILAPSPLPPIADRITHDDLKPVVLPLASDEPTDKPPTKGSS